MEKSFEREVLDRLTKIETKLDDYSKIKEKTDEAYTLSKQNEKDIGEISGKLKWISNTAIGAIITGLISILFLFLKTGMGLK